MPPAAWAAWAKRSYKLHCVFVALPKSYLLNGEDTLNRNHNSERWNDATETRRLVLLLTHPWNAILVVGIKKNKKKKTEKKHTVWLIEETLPPTLCRRRRELRELPGEKFRREPRRRCEMQHDTRR